MPSESLGILRSLLLTALPALWRTLTTLSALLSGASGFCCIIALVGAFIINARILCVLNVLDIDFIVIEVHLSVGDLADQTARHADMDEPNFVGLRHFRIDFFTL